jgi:hypothetical protein
MFLFVVDTCQEEDSLKALKDSRKRLGYRTIVTLADLL